MTSRVCRSHECDSHSLLCDETSQSRPMRRTCMIEIHTHVIDAHTCVMRVNTHVMRDGTCMLADPIHTIRHHTHMMSRHTSMTRNRTSALPTPCARTARPAPCHSSGTYAPRSNP